MNLTLATKEVSFEADNICLSGGRVCVLNFKVTQEEKDIREEYASKRKLKVGEYIREAIFSDMVLSDHRKALKRIAFLLTFPKIALFGKVCYNGASKTKDYQTNKSPP